MWVSRILFSVYSTFEGAFTNRACRSAGFFPGCVLPITAWLGNKEMIIDSSMWTASVELLGASFIVMNFSCDMCINN